MRQTHVPPNDTRSTKLQGTQCSPELAFRSADFHVPENLIFQPCVHTSNLAAKSDLISLKAELDKIYMDKLLSLLI